MVHHRDASLACLPAGAWSPARPGYRARLIFHILAWPASGQANNDQATRPGQANLSSLLKIDLE